MTPENFCYFLQGYLETSNPEFISAAQTQVIKDHLNLVFNKATPNRTDINKDIEKTVIGILNESKRVGGYNPNKYTPGKFDDSNIALLKKQETQLYYPENEGVRYCDKVYVGGTNPPQTYC